MTKVTLAEQLKRREDANGFLASFSQYPIQNVLGTHFVLKNDCGKQFIPFLPIKLDYKEDGSFTTKGAKSDLTLEQMEQVKINGEVEVEKKTDGSKYNYKPLKLSEATHYELRLNFGKPKMIIDIDGFKESGDITMSEYWESEIPSQIQSAPFFLSRTKSLPHHIFYIEGLPEDIKPDKYINVFKDFNGDILLNHAWEMNNSKVYNYNGEIPTLQWDRVKEWLNPNAKPVKEHLLKNNKPIFAKEVKEEKVKKEKKVKKQIEVLKASLEEESDDDTENLYETKEDAKKDETKEIKEKCETIKKYVEGILEEDEEYFDEYDKWMVLGFICNNETDADDEGCKTFVDLSKLFHTDSGKKHEEKKVKAQYYKAQKSRKKNDKAMIGTLHQWLQELNPDNEILKAGAKLRMKNGDMTKDEVRLSEDYISYRKVFEKDYFKLMTPVRYVREIQDKKGKLIHFYTEKDFLTLTRDEEGMPSFLIKSGTCIIPVKFSELWLDDEKKRKYSRLKFDPMETPDAEDCKKKEMDYNCFAGFQNKDLEVNLNKDFDKTAFGKLFNHLFVEDIVIEYLKCWFSHILKKPNIKTKVAVVLYSKTHGTGKNTFVDYIIKILGSLLCGQVECIDDITKNFNAHLCNKLLIYGDEINANAKKVADRLKQVITRPTQNLEKKNVDAVEVDDFTNWIFTTNNENCFKIEEGDRRMLMVRCRELYQFNISAECYEEMADKDFLKQMFSFFYHYKQSEESVKRFGKFNIGSDRVIDTQYKRDLLYENKTAYIQALFKEPKLFANKKFLATELFEITQQFAKRKFLSSNYTMCDFGLGMSKYFNEVNGYKKRGNKGEYYLFGSETELLKLLFEKDEAYYRYVYNLSNDFTPKFLPPKEVVKTSWNGKEYIDIEEEE